MALLSGASPVRADEAASAERPVAEERAWLVSRCVRLTHCPDAAEDLAHEILCRAYRAAAAGAGPRPDAGPAGRRAWLAGVAKHVCADWIRGRQRARAFLSDYFFASPHGPANDWADASTAFDLEQELERRELLDLLDRAMGHVPAETRSLLVAHHVEELPIAEAAARLGLSVGAAAVRLHRGRAAVRRALLTTFREDAVAFGLATPGSPASGGDSDLVQTRMWCQVCGQRRLLGRYAPDLGLYLRCPDCTRGNAVYTQAGWGEPIFGLQAAEFFGGVMGFKAAANRLDAAIHAFYEPGIAGRLDRCRHCGRWVPMWVDWYGTGGDIMTRCWHGPYCAGLVGVGALATASPEFRAFARRNPRLQGLRQTCVETAGVPSVVFSFQSRSCHERIDFVFARESLVRLSVHGGAPIGRSGRKNA